MIYKILCLLTILFIAPMLIGSIWVEYFTIRNKRVFSFVIGFFTELAVFQILSIPFVFFHWKFSILVIIFSIVTLALCFYSIWSKKHKEISKFKFKQTHSVINNLLLISLIAIISIQIYRCIAYDISYMSYDDAGYTVYAVDALTVDRLGMIDDYTGIWRPISYKYAVSSWLYFPAYISSISTVSVATLLHTIINVYAVVLAYSSCWLMAGEFFENKREQLIFLLLISVFYWFGYHSHYSLTFRLLGPNYQGKAIVAVSLTPVLLTIIIKLINRDYSWKGSILLIMLSVAATALTLWGAGTFIIIEFALIVISMFKKNRKWKHLIYIPIGSLYPVIFFVGYILYKYGI